MTAYTASLEQLNGNRLLDALSTSDAGEVLSKAKRVSLRRGETTTVEDLPMRNVDFPLTALMSVTSSLSDGTTCEVATIGSEAFVEVDAALEATTALRRASCQFSGDVARMPLQHFQACLERNRPFALLVRRAVRARMFISEQTQMCNLRHTVSQRLARWLLIASERLERRRFSVTHDLLASTLGVRRAGVTNAIAHLRLDGAISHGRGVVEITERESLAASACECYEVSRDAIARSLAVATAV